jgi:hypothetical protein
MRITVVAESMIVVVEMRDRYFKAAKIYKSNIANKSHRPSLYISKLLTFYFLTWVVVSAQSALPIQVNEYLNKMLFTLWWMRSTSVPTIRNGCRASMRTPELITAILL